MLVAVRHARTDYNEDGTERLRAWLPIPISSDGVAEAHTTGRFLKTLNLPFTVVLSSPMKRSVQTARIIGRILKRPVQTALGLADWNVGRMAGQNALKTLPEIHRLLDNSQEAPPGGEPYAAFRARLDPFMKALIQSPHVHLAVTHNRCIIATMAVVTGDPQRIKFRGPVEPGGVVQFNSDGSMQVLHGGRSAAELAQPSGETRKVS